MDTNIGLGFTCIIFTSFLTHVLSSQLYLQPTKSDHAYFTGDNFFITCFTTDENIDKLTWTDFEGNPVSTTEGRVHAQPAEGIQLGLRLVFTNVEKEDAGTYTCSDDQDSVSFELIVYRAVSFGDTQKVQHAPEGEDGVILCNVKSDPKPVVNWYFKGGKIRNSDKYKLNENHSLRINKLTREDAGDYKCKAFVITPLSSQVKDFDVNLHVQYKPVVIGDSRVTAYASKGSTKDLNCTITADPVPMFQWVRDDMILRSPEDVVITNTDNTSTLRLVIEDDSPYGEYVCRANNPLGEEKVTFTLKEGYIPAPPELSVVGEDMGVVKLQLKATHPGPATRDNEHKVTGFKVEYKMANELWSLANSQDFKLGGVYELRNMSYNTDYLLRAVSINAAGNSNFSDEVAYKTHPLQTASVISGARSIIAPLLLILGFALAGPIML